MNYFLNIFSKVALIVFLLSSCKSDESPITIDIDPDFELYVQSFIEEGAKRGKEIDFSDTGLLVEYSDRIVEGASGFCYVGQHHIVIDKAEWDALADNVKTFLMFHELGHCELERGHVNDILSNGLWKSMMRGDPLTGAQKFRPVPFHGFRKAYYNDELFDINSPAPVWSNVQFQYESLTEDDKQTLSEKTDVNRLFEVVQDPGLNYEIEIRFNSVNHIPSVGQFQWGTSSNFYVVQIIKNFGIYIGEFKGGLFQRLFFSADDANINGQPFKKITIRQQEDFVQVYFNEVFIFYFDKYPGTLSQIIFEATDQSGTLSPNFIVESFKLSQIP